MIRKSLLFFFALFSLVSTAFAETGATLTLPLVPKDPPHLHGYRAAFWYQPPTFIWKHFNIFFDISYGHWWINGNGSNRQINIIALAPTVRLYFKRSNFISPFMDLSLGLSYLSNTRIDTRNLGMHFSFQDQAGLGVTIGKAQKLSVSLSAMHYSNGSTCAHNSGITIPLLLNVGYQF